MRQAVKRGPIALVIASLLVVAGGLMAQDAVASATMIATTTVNVRSAPNPEAAVVGQLKPGERVSRTGANQVANQVDWVPISFQNLNGYVAIEYVRPAVAAVSVTSTPPSKAPTQLPTVATPKPIASVQPDAGVTPSVPGTGSGSEKPGAPTPPAPTPAATPPAPTPPAVTPTPAPSNSVKTVEMRTTDEMNIRRGPGTSFEVASIVPAGTLVATTGKVENAFAEIWSNGQFFWVHSAYLASLNSGLPKPVAGPVVSGKLAPDVQSSKAMQAVAYAKAQLGKPYVWGATGPNSFDCSGLTSAAWRSAGYKIPRIAYNQGYTSGFKRVSDAELQPGDLIIENGGGHVIMYIGDGQIIEAARRGVPIRITTLSSRNKNHIAVRPGA